MKRWLYHYRIVVGDPDALARRLREELPELLARALGREPNPPLADGSFLLELGTEVVGMTLSKHVRVVVGHELAAPGRTVLPLSWRADPLPHGFPAFDGAIELEQLTDDRAQLSLVGAYVPPASVLGALLDSVLLRGVADRAVDAVIDGLAAAVSDPTATRTAPLEPGLVHVEDVMTRDPLLLEEDLTLRTAALLLHHYGISGAPVVDRGGLLVGVLTEGDLLEKEAAQRLGFGREARRSEQLRAARTVGEACSRTVRTTAPDVAVHDAAREMLRHHVARLVVLDAGRIAGLISRHDVLEVLARDDLHLAEAAHAVLADLGERGVRVVVSYGHMTVRGQVSTRSRVAELRARLEEIDGAVDVEVDQLAWHDDDVALTARDKEVAR